MLEDNRCITISIIIGLLQLSLIIVEKTLRRIQSESENAVDAEDDEEDEESEL